MVTKGCKDSKVALQIEILLTVHDLHDSRIYVNPLKAKTIFVRLPIFKLFWNHYQFFYRHTLAKQLCCENQEN